MTSLDDYDRPLQIGVIGGSIVVTGPGRFEGALTPAAAEASARALMEAVLRARGPTCGVPGKRSRRPAEDA